jgi:predicted  nucleic acid-binding Zn-ribbon protein
MEFNLFQNARIADLEQNIAGLTQELARLRMDYDSQTHRLRETDRSFKQISNAYTQAIGQLNRHAFECPLLKAQEIKPKIKEHSPIYVMRRKL